MVYLFTKTERDGAIVFVFFFMDVLIAPLLLVPVFFDDSRDTKEGGPIVLINKYPGTISSV